MSTSPSGALARHRAGQPPHVRAHAELLLLPQPSGQVRRLREPQFHWPGQGMSRHSLNASNVVPPKFLC